MGSTGSAQTANTGRFFVGLKPRDQRSTTRPTSSIACDHSSHRSGRQARCRPSQDITVGGRIGRGQYQYTLSDADLDELNEWAPKMVAKLQTLPELADTSTDQQNNAPQLASPSIATRRRASALAGGDRRHDQRGSASVRSRSTSPSSTPIP